MWLALEIGNSRLHWGWFVGETLVYTWQTDYLPAAIVQQLAECQRLEDLPPEMFPRADEGGMHAPLLNGRGDAEPMHAPLLDGRGDPAPTHAPLPLYLASVVPNQTALWQTYPNVRVITLDQVPLQGVYSTLGVDRALALWGAGQNWGFPMLMIDAGTALTFTACDANHCLVGGAILPGLGLQLATLAERTGQLPFVETKAIASLPPRFALNTPEAIQSGVIYTLIAGVKDFVEAWWHSFPEGNVVVTGGDRLVLVKYIESQFPEIAARLIVEPNLIFWGMQEIVSG